MGLGGLFKSACLTSSARRAAPLAAVCKPGTPLDRSIYGDDTSHSGLHLPWARRRPPRAPFYSTLSVGQRYAWRWRLVAHGSSRAYIRGTAARYTAIAAFYRNIRLRDDGESMIHRERFTGRSRPGPLSLHSLYHSDQAPSNYELPRLTPTSYYFRLSDSRLSTPQAEQTQRALVVCISTTLLGEASESAWCTRVGLRGKQPLK